MDWRKTNNITGSVVGKIDKNDTVEPLILFSQAIQKLFQVGEKGDHLKFGALESYIDAEGHTQRDWHQRRQDARGLLTPSASSSSQ